MPEFLGGPLTQHAYSGAYDRAAISADLSLVDHESPARSPQVKARTTRINVAGAMAIWATTAAALWGQWRSVALVVAWMIPTAVFNMWADRAVFRLGIRIEILRMLVNSFAIVSSAALTGWPAPCWLWPPYIALAYDKGALAHDKGHRHYGVVIVVGWSAIQCGAALGSGVSWIFPLSSAVLAAYARRSTVLRLDLIHLALEQSEQERAALEDAKAEVSAALDQLKQETAARERAEVELRAAQRLEAIGRIAAGVAHEINTPVQFVGDNIRFLQEGIGELLALEALDAAAHASDGPARDAAIAAARNAREAAEIAFFKDNLPDAANQALEGVARITSIVAAMRQFARTASERGSPTDLNGAIKATLTVSRSEYKLVADVECALGDIPLVTCNASEINQVLLNIVVNAGQAIADAVGNSGARGTIRVTTVCDGDDVVISIADTGTGIPAAARDYVFDPFFTTKDVGRGTGQGLAIARALVERHRGKLTFDTEVGRGTTFHIRLPVVGYGGGELGGSMTASSTALAS